MSEPTYTITLIIRRSDEPGAHFKANFSDIPREKAERPDYIHASAVEVFRRLCVGELNEAPPAPEDPQV